MRADPRVDRSASQVHWQDVYRTRAPAQTSWARPHLDESLRLIDALGLAPDAPIIDVGGGRSTLVDDLLARGFTDVGVLDISAAALEESRARLGVAGSAVTWIEGDVCAIDIAPARYALWHDRAMFHFLTDAAVRECYVAQAARAVRQAGHAIVATFAPDGPERCSGLPVMRYDAQALAAAFAPAFEPVADARELHRTPWGSEQAFTYLLLRRRDGVVN
jgi:SAM-dependent methyltransferase